MNKGLMILTMTVSMTLAISSSLVAQVYKVVDENGNVTYTDEPPNDGTPEMVLPEISVIESDYEAEADAASGTTPSEEEAGDETAVEAVKTPRELRAMFRDFRILTPQPEESFWGTANTVVVSWGADAPYEDGMSVSVVVDGAAQEASPGGNLSVTLDRGEHRVYAVLMDSLGRRVVTTDTVTFYVHQATINTGRR